MNEENINKRIELVFNSKFTDFQKLNNELTLCKCYVMAIDSTANKWVFSKEAVKKALPSLTYIPVVAHLVEAEDGTTYVGGHDRKLISTDKGMKFSSLCVPFGTVPDAEYSFEEIEEPNGLKTTYLVSPLIVWSGRFPQIMEAIYSEDCYFGQSMEIKLLNSRRWTENPQCLEILDFQFSALCLLGKSDQKDSPKHTQPAFPSARVEPLRFAYDEQFDVQMEAFKGALHRYFSADSLEKGGNKKRMDKEKFEQAVASFGIQMEYTEDLDERTFDAILEAINKSKAEGLSFSSTYCDKRQAICDALKPSEVWDGDRRIEYTRYYLMDFDDNHAYVERYHSRGDDYDTSNGRFSYKYDEKTKTATIDGDFEPMVVKWLTLEEADQIERERAEFAEYRETHSVPDSEVEELREFKENQLIAEKQGRVDAILAEFVDLSENSEFMELRSKAMDFADESELRTQCYAIRGKSVQLEFSDGGLVRTSIVVQRDSKKPYGGLMERYGAQEEAE